MAWCLQVLTGPRAGTEIFLNNSSVVLGRNPIADAAFPEDNFLSGKHCVLEPQASWILVKDAGSTNGTFINSCRIAEARAVHGDLLQAGSLSMRLVNVPQYMPQSGGVLPAANQPASPAPSAGKINTTIHAVLDDAPSALRFITSLPEPLYCLVDAARNPAIFGMLARAQERRESLYDGQSAMNLASWAPYLVELPQGSLLTRNLLEKGWGNAWASFFTSLAPFEELRHHFRKFLFVELEGGREVYFRFYDPRVLRDFLPSTNHSEAELFFGPIARFIVEAEKSTNLFCFTRVNCELTTTEVSLMSDLI